MIPQIIGGLVSLYGAYKSDKSSSEAEDKNRRLQLAENKRRREGILKATETSVRGIERSQVPLLRQANRLERMSKWRDPMVEQALSTALRAQATGAAKQSRAEGVGYSDRAAITSQLMQGQGLLAVQSHRLQRFTQMSQMAAQLRGKGADIMGQASQTRMQGAMAAADISYTGPGYSGRSGLGTGLTALGGALGEMDFGGGGDSLWDALGGYGDGPIGPGNDYNPFTDQSMDWD
jgi:hypothetical protein